MLSLQAWASRLKTDFGFYPVIASELEFYLHGDESLVPDFWSALKIACKQAGIVIFKTEKEKGLGQYEVAINQEPAEISARQSSQMKTIIAESAAAHGLRADFSAKPFEEQPGSGLHIHVHLANAAGQNIFYKDDSIMSDALKYSIGGLLAWLPASMPIFAPTAESYSRFVPSDNTPLTVSWGANNRTVAVRLPDSEKNNKRIEHRIPGIDSDAEKVMAAILAAMHWGISNKAEPGPQIFGNASLPMYNLARIPTSLEEARRQMENSTVSELRTVLLQN